MYEAPPGWSQDGPVWGVPRFQGKIPLSIVKGAWCTDKPQVFVANPNKSVAVQRILINNRDRLLRFLPKFLEDRTDDDQFTDEKSFLVRQIELLPKEPVDRSKPTAQSGVNTAAVAWNSDLTLGR